MEDEKLKSSSSDFILGHAVYKSREKNFKSFEKEYKCQDEGVVVEEILRKFSNDKDEKYDWLERNVFYVIYQFKKYDRDKDSFDLQKANRKEGHEKIDKWIRAVESLRELHKQYPLQRLYPDIEVQKLMDSKKNSTDETIPIKDLTLQYLDAIKKGLNKYKTAFKNSPSGGWFIAGIQYPSQKPNGDSFRIPTEPDKASLLLHLVNIFRHYTANKPDLGWAGKPMPKFGKPCYGTVANIATVVYGGGMDKSEGAVSEKVKSLIKSGVTLHSWPLPSE